MKTKRILSIWFVCFALFVNAQTSCYETVTLPSDTKWGGGDAVGSVLIGNTYGAGQGPGIYIIADGGYRLYLNGELLAYDNAAGRVRFIPMTFLPGTNALSVMGINGQSAPGVMVQIDELERSYYSNGDWKVGVSPTDNTWKNKSFSDASWSAATVQSAGSVTALPSGSAFTGFPASSQSKWIWSGSSANTNVVLRYTFTIKAVGYGAATTGGDAGTVVLVKTAQEFLDHVQNAGTEIILVPEGTFDVRVFQTQSVCYVPCNSSLNTYKGYSNYLVGTCPGTQQSIQRWDKLIWIKANKSVIGMGRGASIRGGSFYCNSGQSNMIFRNLKIWDVNPHIVEANDGISPSAANNVWVDHCTFKWISDGNDIGDSYQTWSWNMFDGQNEFMCSGHDNYTMALGRDHITFDHDYWYECAGRDPDAAEDNYLHVLNNYHQNNTFYAVNSANRSQIRVEGSVFDNVSLPLVTDATGLMYEVNNVYNNCGSFSRNYVNVSAFKDAIFTIPYTYTVESTATVANTVKTNSGAGGRWRIMPLYTDVAGLSSTAPVVSITAPTAGQVFTNPSSISITAAVSASSAVSKVEFYSGTVLIGTATASPYTISFNQFTTCSYSVVAVAYDSKNLVSMSLPITFSVSAAVKTCVYSFPSGSDLWTNTANWTPAVLPSSIDTAIIRTGEARLAQDFAGYIKVEPSGILRATAFTNLSSLELLGGAIKVNTSNQTYGMKANIVVKVASSVIAGSNLVTIFTLDGTIAGSANLTKKDLGLVKLNATAADFKGQWIVDQDTLTIASATGLGQCGAIVNTAVLDIDVAASTNALTVNKGGKLNLDANLTVQAAVFDTINLAAGTYTAANYPTFISGNGSLIVAKSLLSIGAASAGSITLTASAGSTYSWMNGTSSVASTAAFSPTATGSYTVKASTTAGCAISSAPVLVQAIALEKGWNLISINLIPDTTIVDVCRDARPCVSTIFAGLDVLEIKDMNSFWRKGQADVFNGLKTITPGNGYLVNMNIAGKLMIAGVPVQTRFIASPEFIASLQSANWNLIGCPYQSASPFSQDFNASNCSVIKDFTGFWIPNGTSNSLQNTEVGKGYFIKK